jgi:hypothetical protein
MYRNRIIQNKTKSEKQNIRQIQSMVETYKK